MNVSSKIPHNEITFLTESDLKYIPGVIRGNVDLRRSFNITLTQIQRAPAIVFQPSDDFVDKHPEFEECRNGMILKSRY